MIVHAGDDYTQMVYTIKRKASRLFGGARGKDDEAGPNAGDQTTRGMVRDAQVGDLEQKAGRLYKLGQGMNTPPLFHIVMTIEDGTYQVETIWLESMTGTRRVKRQR